MESLKQAGRSALYSEMTLLYQDSLTVLYGLPKASDAIIRDGLKKIRFCERLLTIVTKYMGPVISEVELFEGLPNAWCSTTVEDKYSVKAPDKATIGMLMDKISYLYDDSAAKYSGKLLPIVRFEFGVSLGFWRLRNPDKSYVFTAEELAALTLHEIGHMDNNIRSCYRIDARIQDASDIVNYINKSPDPTVVQAIIKSLNNSKYVDKSWAPVLKATTDYFKSNKTPNDPYYFEAINVLSTLVTAELSNRNRYLIDSIFLPQSTTKALISHDVDSERSADEFASRSGAYASLVSVLKKLNDLDTTKSYMQYRLVSSVPIALLVSVLVRFSSVFDISAEDISFGYDPIIRRLELVVETAKHGFKDNDDLPKRILDDIKSQILEAEAYIAEAKSARHRRIRKALYEWKQNVSKFGRIVISPFQNRLSDDYDRLTDANRAIGRHSLYYLVKR